MDSLLGKIIISTRPIDREDIITSTLQNYRATILHFPTIEITPTLHEINIDKRELSQFDYIIFTSRNGVKYFFEYLKTINFDWLTDFKPSIQWLVIGPGTADELRPFWKGEISISQRASAAELADEMISKGIQAKNILLPLAHLASAILEQKLGLQNRVKRCNIYQTNLPKIIDPDILQRVVNRQYDLLICTSPSTIINLVKIAHHVGTEITRLKIACIGHTTETTALEYNILPKITSSLSNGSIFACEIHDYLLKM